jgi:myo-inositol-1(or 4)-monophosphatase
MSERQELVAIALRVAEEAGALLARGYRSRPRADMKGRKDLVTEFDRASEALVVERLRAATPGIPIVGEEGSGVADAAHPGPVWYVDPLDGTTNFVHGHPFHAVSIGLLWDDRPALGAVVAPALATWWTGRIEPDGQAEARRNGEPCGVSIVDALIDGLLATGFSPSGPDDNFPAYERVKRAAQGVRRCGSAALDLCLVADGTYDAYWERRLHTWDVAAGAAIALAAGARVTSLSGGPTDWHVGHLVASNGLLHGALLALVAEPA